MKHEHFFLHTVRNETSDTRKDTEELISYLNTGCEIVDEFNSDNEQYFVLFRPHEEVEEKKLN